MKTLLFAAALLSCVTMPIPAHALSVQTIQASELTIGEEGYGLTVLQGEEIRIFKVSYIGKMDNAMPSYDILLVRLEDPEFEKTGVIAGMSGSPIYFRGRLLGALAYAWGFSKEPIAGVTPINLMAKLLDQQDRYLAKNPPKGMSRIATPLSVSGLSPDKKGEAWKRIEELGLMAMPGGRSDVPASVPSPGGAMGVRLIDGDLSLTAIGTITDVDDSSVIGFGHPFLNRGISNLPMTGARIVTIMPSLNISTKMGSATNDVGTLYRDGLYGIAGRTGPAPSMIPMEVNLEAPWGPTNYRYKIARDELLSPMLMNIAWASSAGGGLFALGPAGVEIDVSITVEGRTVTLRDRGVVSSSVLEVMPTLPVFMIYRNPFRQLHPDSIAISVKVTEDQRLNQIIELKPLVPSVVAGETLPLEVVFQTYGVGRWSKRVDIFIPKRTPVGEIVVSAFAGRGLDRDDQAAPIDVEQLLDRLAAYEPQDMLIISAALRSGYALEIDGGMLPDLPSSVAKVQTGMKAGPARIENKILLDVPVVGARYIKVKVEKE